MADAAYDDLLNTLAKRGFTDVTPSLRANIVAYYGSAVPLPALAGEKAKHVVEVREQLAALVALTTDAARP